MMRTLHFEAKVLISMDIEANTMMSAAIPHEVMEMAKSDLVKDIKTYIVGEKGNAEILDINVFLKETEESK